MGSEIPAIYDVLSRTIMEITEARIQQIRLEVVKVVASFGLLKMKSLMLMPSREEIKKRAK